MRRVRAIHDLETLKAIADPTRVAMLELLAEPRSVSELADAIGVPRTRLYHHIGVLEDSRLIEQVDERRAGALTERVYALTARVLRPSARLLRSGDVEARTEVIATLVFDTTKADVLRAVASGEVDLDAKGGRRLAVGRSIAHLSSEDAASLIEELEDVVSRFDDAHGSADDARPYALAWALYPSSRTIG